MHGLMTSLLAAALLGPTDPPAPAAPKGSEAEFISTMQSLQRQHKLVPMARFDSKRFTAISNASDAFTKDRLKHCEIFQAAFLRHFAGKGFAVQTPTERMMVAVFSNSEGFNAYFRRNMTNILGVYDQAANRLVLYDYSHDRIVRNERDKILDQGANIRNDWQRQKYEQTVQRRIGDYTKDVNLFVTMHECAHLVSFNCGLLNRTNDVPAWLAEGLACYCETTEQGDWMPIGTPNGQLIHELRRANNDLFGVTDLLRNDRWVQSSRVLTGYAESWALFHMLMTERTTEMRRYLEIIRDRRTPESRLADFRAAFGDLGQVQARYDLYRRNLLARE